MELRFEEDTGVEGPKASVHHVQERRVRSRQLEQAVWGVYQRSMDLVQGGCQKMQNGCGGRTCNVSRSVVGGV